MPVEKKKGILIPLNNPNRRRLRVRVVIAILRPPFIVLGFVFGNVYKIFGRLDERAARKNEQLFADEVRTHLSFLFTEHGAQIIANEGVAFPRDLMGHM